MANTDKSVWNRRLLSQGSLGECKVKVGADSNESAALSDFENLATVAHIKNKR